MVAYNFQQQFATDVAALLKRQTIRAPGKDNGHAKKGDRLQLYTGMRTKNCRKLVDPDPICIASEPITLTVAGITYPENGKCMTPGIVAKRDGFPSYEAMLEWFQKTHGLPFNGQLIRW